MERIDDGGPAFPHDNQELGNRHRIAQPGMSLRDWFAGRVLGGLVSNPSVIAHDPERGYSLVNRSFDDVASECYAMADAMLKARGSDAR